MRRRTWCGVMVALVAAGGVVAGCAPDTHRPLFHRDEDDMEEFSAAHLGDRFGETSVWQFLTPEERAAMERSQMSPPPRDELAAPETDQPATPENVAGESSDQPQGTASRALDKAGKVGVSLLAVGVSLGALVAPFFLF